ncbi:hypothetical protein I316_01877 [Kwoniella heveanensis BCC8398]|uniref:AAA+ ATPase domain-containing protein n=1 Tax=Kwoniella heveanensis BCC8398 TaxID=1296120 RepID=A0A1B9H027_9TREE|nr:hypothetical protein I316_01877 [Kwoniella heveanensis BCC8398]
MAPPKSLKGSSSTSNSIASGSSSSSSAPLRRLGSMSSFQPSLSFKPVPKTKVASPSSSSSSSGSPTSSGVKKTQLQHQNGSKKEHEDRKRMPPPTSSFTASRKSFSSASAGKSPNQSAVNRKGKGKEKEVIELLDDDDDLEEGDAAEKMSAVQMWTELYAPKSETELAPGKARIQRVKNWLHESLYGCPFDAPAPPRGVNRDKIRKYKRVLLLTGPAGTGKTTTVRLLARDLGVEVMEWGEGVEEWSLGGGIERESSMSKFTSFLSRHSFPSMTFSPNSAISSQTAKPRIILLTALPNLSHLPTREAFHAALLNFCQDFESSSCPMIIVHSDAGAGGRAEESWMDRERGGREGSLEMLGRDVKDGPCFLPLAQTFLTKALLRVLQTAIPRALDRPSQSTVQLIAQSSHGDLRSAINSLQLLCAQRIGKCRKRKIRDGDEDDDDDEEPGSKKGKRKGAIGKGSRGGKGGKLDVSRELRAVLDAVTRKEQSLGLFHALGKVFYNKRLSDPSIDEEGEEVLEAIRRLPLDEPLPKHLHHFARSKSLTQMESFIPSVPVDASSFALWIHQSFPEFCQDIEQTSTGLDALCSADIMRTDDDIWQSSPQAIAYALHLSIRGIQMALPSPVPRRSQKVIKPQFFEFYRQERENVSSLDHIAGYIAKKGVVGSNACADGEKEAGAAGVWGGMLPKRIVATEMVPMMLKLSSTSRKPLLPSSAQSLILPSYALSADRNRFAELTAKDELDQDENDAAGLVDDDQPMHPQAWAEDLEDQPGEGEGDAGDLLEDDDIMDWD